MLEMVKRREKTKREQLHLSIEIFEKRVQLHDYSGSLVSELSSTIKSFKERYLKMEQSIVDFLFFIFAKF